MTILIFDPVAFRAQFSQFSNANCFSNPTLQGFWDTASGFVTTDTNAMLQRITPAQQVMACNLMTAHIAYIYNALLNNQPLGVVTDASIDKVRVSLKPPPFGDSQFQYWLSLSPYGQQLMAMFTIATAGGWFVGGIPERNAFRRAYGGFGGIPPRGVPQG